jgi:hypothetical protein
MSSTEEVSVKITKGNFTKVVINKFLENIDYDKKYKLNELKDMLTNSYKSIKEKKVVNKKTPTEYNIFVGEKTKELKTEFPNLNNTEIFKKTAELWNEYKKTKS